MKKLLLCTLFICNTIYAQIVISPNPFSVNTSTVTFRYGQTGDYSIFNPNSDPNLFLYTGLETDGVASTWDYTDVFTNNTTQIPLTYNTAQNCYVATFSIGTRNYRNVLSGTTGPIPSTTIVNNWYFLITNASGSVQSADLKGSDYGFVGGQLSTNKNQSIKNQFIIASNSITSYASGASNVSVYNALGQAVAQFIIDENETRGLPNLQKGMYVAEIRNNENVVDIKFVK